MRHRGDAILPSHPQRGRLLVLHSRASACCCPAVLEMGSGISPRFRVSLPRNIAIVPFALTVKHGGALCVRPAGEGRCSAPPVPSAGKWPGPPDPGHDDGEWLAELSSSTFAFNSPQEA